MLELNKQESWEKEFDKTFELTDPVPVWTTNEGKGYGKTTLGNVVKNFIRSQRQQAQKEVLEELEKRMPEEEELKHKTTEWSHYAIGFDSCGNEVLEIINQLKGE